MKVQWKKKLRDIKLSKKMLFVYAVFAGVSCIISIIALQMSLNIYDSKLYEKSLQELDFFTQQVNTSLNDIEKASSSIALNAEIQNQLALMESYEYMSAQYSLGLYQLREMIEDELVSAAAVKNIIYTDKKEAEIKAGTDTGKIGEGEFKEILEDFQGARGGYISKNPTADYPYLLSGRDILERKNASLDYLGSLILTSDISGIIGQNSDSLEAAHSTLFVYSKDGMIYQDDTQAIPKLPDVDHTKGYEVVHIQGEKYFMCYLRSSMNDWMYVNIFPYSDIFGQVMNVRYLLIGGFLILFICMVVVMRKMSVVIVRPLNQLTESMRIVEKGDFKGAKQVLDKDLSNDETGLLAQEFKVMLDKIDILIYENYEKQLLLQDTKYKMLQAQINPHFLYNTLNALNWMVKGKRNDDAGKVIIELGKLLRASFAKDPYTTVAGELEVAKGYIVIQKYRYQNRVEFEVSEEGNLDQYMIPRMILQPLIENAIYYGVDASLEGCRITVCVKEEPEAVLLTVEDTGPGMEPEELEKVRNGTAVPKGHGIGIKNIRERLKITYEDSEFSIDSRKGHGTKIQIRIPKMCSEVDHV
ncbi:Sensor histidine kinase YehU [Blautia producta]|uniref:histidine kinase n=1 Tax=Blautia producta TaxID=33035 RepID=A0A4V0Z7M2_9FIRM|nr:histidine kinase [Blautia producta]QBE97288.1 Sensor histidine kinase YehU [Blautia producta]